MPRTAPDQASAARSSGSIEHGVSAPVLNPGDSYSVAVGTGPKVCHFQDLLAPLSTGYSGILRVHDEQEERRLATQD